MIKTCKILNNIYDPSIKPKLVLNKFNRTKGKNLKLENMDPHIWNNLPNYVTFALNVDQFKVNLNNYWLKYEILYNYKAQPLRAGSTILFFYKEDLINIYPIISLLQ